MSFSTLRANCTNGCRRSSKTDVSNDGLSPAHIALRDAARACFAARYGKPTFYVAKALKAQLHWTPALRFTLHGHIHVFVEPSDSGPYPRSLAMLYAKASNYPEPIAVYSICHEAAMETTAGRQERKDLKSHGFGLVTVDPTGDAQVEFTAIPIVQVIAEADFRQQTRDLPKGIRQPASEAFEDYLAKPVNGVKTLSEIVEGMVRKAGRDSAANGGISNGDAKKTPALVLDALHTQYTEARSAIGGARNFMDECRNLAHHWPKNRKAAYKKYADCRHHFMGGLHTIRAFRTAMKSIGLTGNLGKT